MKESCKGYILELFGVIQGVGFRPFVYQVATRLKIKGFVQNRYNSLFIYFETSRAKSKAFLQEILQNSPPNARISHHTLQEFGLDSPLCGTHRALMKEYRASAPLSKLANDIINDIANDIVSGFEILPSLAKPCSSAESGLFFPKDTRICQECLSDMGLNAPLAQDKDTSNSAHKNSRVESQQNPRFKHYAFSTCAHCGARHSIIYDLPYDRAHTSMRHFKKCESCARDYANPKSRYFHAQPISCHQCAIRMRAIEPCFSPSPASSPSSPSSKQHLESRRDSKCCLDVSFCRIHTYPKPQDDMLLLALAARRIMEGKIVAIKGVGGFNLIASANHKDAITALRARKNRPKKPFALMFQSIEDIESLAHINDEERAALLSPEAPIVLLERHFGAFDTAGAMEAMDTNHTQRRAKRPVIDKECLELIAPELATIGAILPYNGIMHLLFTLLDTPLLFTSANAPGEPIITHLGELMEKLCGVFDIALDYEREITHGLDDSIMRYMAGSMRPLRLSRGYAPLALPLPQIPQSPRKSIKNAPEQALILGVGAQQKASFALSLRAKAEEKSLQNVLISPYLGDLQSVDSLMRYENELDFFTHLYAKKKAAPTLVISDLHPRYATTQLAQNLAGQNLQIQHARVSHHQTHFYAILGENDALNANTFGIIWDGTGLGEDSSIWGGECFLYEGKSASMRRIYTLKPFALLGGEGSIKDISRLAFGLLSSYGFKQGARDLALDSTQMLESAFKSGAFIKTSSMGRLIDSIAYLLGILEFQSYEGQSGALLESYALQCKAQVQPFSFEINKGIIDCSAMIGQILQLSALSHKEKCHNAKRFLETLAHIALRLSLEVGQNQQVGVFFSGGVFQNKFLCDRIHALFSAHHIPFCMHRILPCNDGCISYGQVVYGICAQNTLSNT